MGASPESRAPALAPRGRIPHTRSPYEPSPGYGNAEKCDRMGRNHNIVPLDSHPRARARAAGGPASASLDLLAQLFDEIAAEPGLPATIRSEIARLRIPALR